MLDELASLLVGLIRLALGVRGYDVYGPAQESLGGLLGVVYENPADLKRLENSVRSIIGLVKALTSTPPAETDIVALVSALVSEIGEGPLRRTFRQCDNDAYFRDVQAALAALMAEHELAAEDWKRLIDGVEGVGQVRLMTIHKN